MQSRQLHREAAHVTEEANTITAAMSDVAQRFLELPSDPTETRSESNVSMINTSYNSGSAVSSGSANGERLRLIVLVGLQGSGKSTFAALLEEAGWCRVSQDDLGTRHKCELLTKAELGRGINVVIDRCNFDASQRAHWIRLARDYGAVVGCVVFAVPLSVCIQRVQSRLAHPTLPPGPSSKGIVQRAASLFRPPKRSEGIAWCRYVRTSADNRPVLQEILVQPGPSQESDEKRNPSSSQQGCK